MVAQETPNIGNFYRMFEVPGLFHCAGGPGGQPSNTFDALRAWVENGTVPESLPHSYTDQKGETQHRLLCPYPKQSRLKNVSGGFSNATHLVSDFECL
jgi:hypothetical protein